ncbi:hypothetical protein NDU88_002821 [Pleurodeles waltl]|uniref:Uncharacterized protein n=1 Tax=Pleurodeles waltl TaxID=8319 RepID=A0AAV7UC10_PLEWA|nr:hypothetical protein NDU88_002821 [Pleurodeles waltl]
MPRNRTRSANAQEEEKAHATATGVKKQSDENAEESLKEGTQGKPNADEIDKPQFWDSTALHVLGGTWLAQEEKTCVEEEEEEQDAVEPNKKHERPGRGEGTCNRNGSENQANENTEESLKEGAQGKQNPKEIDKPQSWDSTAHHVPQRMWLAQVRARIQGSASALLKRK